MDENTTQACETPLKKRKTDNIECSSENELSTAESVKNQLKVVLTSDDNQCRSDECHNKKEDWSPIAEQTCDSPLSTASESDWQPSTNGAFQWIHNHMQSGIDPREILSKLVPGIESIPANIDNWALWRLLLRLISEPPRRTKLSSVNTFADAVQLIKNSKKIVVLTGAGISVSCGIPDFRSRDGVYARLAVDFPDLPNPESMFDISYFRQDPRPFFKFAKEIYPGQYKPSKIHRFIAMLEKTDRLLRNYTQNIDTLEQVAGITKVVQCHGSFATASCQVCKYQTDCESIREDIFEQVIPRCPNCTSQDEPGILKPDIVFFGENLPEHFHRQMTADKDDADLLIVIGSALKVRPVALIPNSLPPNVPQLLINREPLSHMSFDVELLGDGDVIVSEICRQLGDDFTELLDSTNGLQEIRTLPEEIPNSADESDTGPYKSKNNNSDKSGNDLLTGTPCKDPETDPRADHVHKPSLDTSGDRTSTADSTTTESDAHTEQIDEAANASCLPNRTAVVSHGRSGTRLEPNAPDSRNESGECSTINSSAAKSPLKEPSDFTVPSVEDSQSRTSNESEGADSQCAAVTDTSDMDVSRSSEFDEMKGFWKSRWKQSISKRLAPGSYYYDGDHRYIFPGAEVAPEEESDSSDEDNDDSSSSSDDSSPSDGLSPYKRHQTPPSVSLHRSQPAATCLNEGEESEPSLADSKEPEQNLNMVILENANDHF